MEDSKPLVSICVISYNSSDFVLETLESAKAQSYQQIELVISDDGSTDETIELCKNWLSENKDRFVRTELITVDKNTGIPANCNRAVKAANGKWIKLIAADDILLESCIKDNVEYVIAHPEVELLFSKIMIFLNQNGKKEMLGHGVFSKKFYGSNAVYQYKELLLDYRIYSATPTSFISAEILSKLNYFDEEFRLMEDYPFFVKYTREGHKLSFMDKTTVWYRQHDSSVDSTLRRQKNHLVDPIEYRHESFRRKYTYPSYIHVFKWNKKYLYKINSFFINKENSQTNRFLIKLLIKYLNPLHWILFIKFHLNSKDEFWMLKKSIRKLN